jgi:hypothetical protein
MPLPYRPVAANRGDIKAVALVRIVYGKNDLLAGKVRIA